MTRCSLVVILRRLKSVDSGDGGSFGRNRGTYLPEYRASQNIKHLSSLSLLWESQILHLQTGSHACLNLLCLTKFKYSSWQKLCVSHDTEFFIHFTSFHQFAVSLLMSYIYISRTASHVVFYIFSQQISVLNILNMLHILRSFLFKIPFVS
jgi:hypothetical protein